jgi:hypothetical protein
LRRVVNVENDFDIFVDSKFHSIVKKYSLNNAGLSSICESNSVFMNFHNDQLSEEPQDGYIPCYVAHRKGNIKYIEEVKIMKKGKKLIDSWKVFTPFASGYGVKFNYFGSKIIGRPGEVCSNTFLTLKVSSEDECQSLISYMNTKFCCFFLSLRKKTQNMNKKTLQWIPLIPFDRVWSDEMLFEYFDLDKFKRGPVSVDIKYKAGADKAIKARANEATQIKKTARQMKKINNKNKKWHE